MRDEGILILTEMRDVQPKKDLFPIVLTDEGIVMEVRFMQPAKADFPIDVTVEGIMIEEREVQWQRAPSLIVEIDEEEGMLME